MSRRYKYVGTGLEPGYGAMGEAAPAVGCHDLGSVEQGAWVFQPDDSEFAYYVDPERDLQFIENDVSGWTDAQRLADDMLHDPGALGL